MYRSVPWVDPLDVSLARQYPERADRDDPWYERFATAVLDRSLFKVQRWYRERTLQLSAIVEAVDPHKSEFGQLSDEMLAAHAKRLRHRLHREGLVLPLVGESFALVREVAYRTKGVRHYDVQLMGGWALLQGRLVEMATGEGKTLTASLAAATAALSGVPTHVVTVNDYLATRDAEEMGPIYRFLGLSVGNVVEGMAPEQRRSSYACDITYCSNKELAFDYLRDQVAGRASAAGLRADMARLQTLGTKSFSPLVLNGLHFAIVDEADSIFIDEARTPLILSSTGDEPEDAGPYRAALTIAAELVTKRDFRILPEMHAVELSDHGCERIAQLSADLGEQWRFKRIREDRVRQALSAIHLYHRDKDYLVSDGKVSLVGEGTGRLLKDHAWEGGLHQMIECKEGLELTPPRQTLARLTYQRLFRRFILLAGMTGTAKEVATEVRAVYGIDVVRIPLNRPSQRVYRPATICANKRQKWEQVVEATLRAAESEGRPVLIGTRTVKDSEMLHELLCAVSVDHLLLNAKNNKEEADIIATAGGQARITVATNMAGRGTDICLAPGVAEQGGLHVILTECHESPRIDRQLFGRSARQGDPGSCEMIVSIDDDIFQTNAKALANLVRRILGSQPRSSRWVVTGLRRASQMVAERRNAGTRRQVFKQDRQLDRMMAFAGTRE